MKIKICIMLISGCNKLELRYNSQLPFIAPYSKNKELAFSLIEKTKKIITLMIAISLLHFSLLDVLI